MAKLEDIIFITGSTTQSFKTIVSIDRSSVIHIFEITKGDEKRTYNPKEYLRLLLEWYYYESDKTKNNRKKLVCIANAESRITRLINEFGLDKLGYDFSDIYRDIAVTEKRILSYYNATEKRNSFLYGALITICSASISGLGVWALSLSIQNKPQENNIVFPKIYLIHDTVYSTSR